MSEGGPRALERFFRKFQENSHSKTKALPGRPQTFQWRAHCVKCPNEFFFSGPYFPVFGLNTGKYGPEKNSIFGQFSCCGFARIVRSHRRCSARIGVLRNFTKFRGKHLYQSLFIKKRLWHRCFPENFAKFLRTLFLQNVSGRLLVNCEWLLSFISEFLEFCGGPGCSPVRIPILVTMQHSRWILFWKSCSLEVLLKQEFKTKYDLKIEVFLLQSKTEIILLEIWNTVVASRIWDHIFCAREHMIF